MMPDPPSDSVTGSVSEDDRLRRRLQHALDGEFTLVRQLGRGGMGAVYLARELALDRLVAIKVLPPETSEGWRPPRTVPARGTAGGQADAPEHRPPSQFRRTRGAPVMLDRTFLEQTLRELCEEVDTISRRGDTRDTRLTAIIESLEQKLATAVPPNATDAATIDGGATIATQ